MGKAMGVVGVTLAGPEVARATSEYHICLFLALEKPKKAEISPTFVSSASLLDGWHAGW